LGEPPPKFLDLLGIVATTPRQFFVSSSASRPMRCRRHAGVHGETAGQAAFRRGSFTEH